MGCGSSRLPIGYQGEITHQRPPHGFGGGWRRRGGDRGREVLLDWQQGPGNRLDGRRCPDAADIWQGAVDWGTPGAGFFTLSQSEERPEL